MTNHFSLARFLLWIPPLLWYRIIWGFSAQTASAGSVKEFSQKGLQGLA